MEETNLIERVREERVPGHNEGLCINDAKIETSGDDAAEEWSTPVNSTEEKRKRRIYKPFHQTWDSFP